MTSAEFHYRIGWLWMYCGALLMSALASAIAAFQLMRKNRRRILQSSLQFVIWHFLAATSLHAWIALGFYVALIAQLMTLVENKSWARDQFQNGSNQRDWHSLTASSIGESELDGIDGVVVQDHDHDGPEAAYISKLIHSTTTLRSKLLLLTLLLENVSVMFCAFWLFLTTHELFYLARTTLDRGVDGEKRKIHKYACAAVAVALVLFAVACAVGLGVAHDLNRSYRILLLGEFVIGVVVIVYAVYALVYLRCKGRELEHVHGKWAKSPLYRRLKSLLVVCFVFTLPYWFLQLVLLVVPVELVDNFPDYLMGACTLLFYFFGLAQAVIMGASQACCFRLLTPLVPQHVREDPEWIRVSDPNGVAGCEEAHVSIDPPGHSVVFVNTDIESSSELWAKADLDVINAAQTLHDDLLRNLLIEHRGYEITTCGDSFQLAFHNIQNAIEYCLDAQLELLHLRWPSGLDRVVACSKTERAGGLHRQVLFKGLRVRMGIHDANRDEGDLVTQTHPITGKTVYIGASEMIAREISNVGFGGQIIISQRVMRWLQCHSKSLAIPCRTQWYGCHTTPTFDTTVELFEVIPTQLEGRTLAFLKRRDQQSMPNEQQMQCSACEDTKESATSPRVWEFHEIV